MKDHEQTMQMLAYESYIRRAAQLGLPFMLKGSYVTRQYFPDPSRRIPADLDWIYLGKLSDVETSREVFSNWALLATETETNDGVEFASFSENAFWRMIDYAMDDDFPTVNTDLACTVDGFNIHSLPLDISFNLPVDFPPVPLLYKPLRGDAFTIPYTAPLCLQVSWKIHQTLVRPRFKDLFDLTYLLQHASFDEDTLGKSIDGLLQEVNKDGVDLIRFYQLLTGQIDVLFEQDIQEVWDVWRNGIRSNSMSSIFAESASEITDVTALPYNLQQFLDNFYIVFRQAGFTPSLIDEAFENRWNERTRYIVYRVNAQRKEQTRNGSVFEEKEEQGNPFEKEKELTILGKLKAFFRLR